MFERDIYNQLQKWAERTGRKPLVLRGARQVGKTTLVNEFARNFENYLHLNLEREEDARLFQSTDKVQEIMKIACFQKNILLRLRFIRFCRRYACLRANATSGGSLRGGGTGLCGGICAGVMLGLDSFQKFAWKCRFAVV